MSEGVRKDASRAGGWHAWLVCGRGTAGPSPGHAPGRAQRALVEARRPDRGYAPHSLTP
jgi:hypothetical protein